MYEGIAFAIEPTSFLTHSPSNPCYSRACCSPHPPNANRPNPYAMQQRPDSRKPTERSRVIEINHGKYDVRRYYEACKLARLRGSFFRSSSWT